MERKYRIGVSTSNRYLFQKIRLGLLNIADTYMYDGKDEGFDAVIVEGEDRGDIPAGTRVITVSAVSQGCDLTIPFSTDDLTELLLMSREPTYIKLAKEKKTAYLGSMETKLTEAEFALLEVLVECGGEFIKREELLSRVWGDNADPGVVTVYIHYLREKLEKNGEKVIISSRKNGYKISERFVGK